MSAIGGKADVRELPSGCPLIAKSEHSGVPSTYTAIWHFDTGACSTAKAPSNMTNQMSQNLSWVRQPAVSDYLTTDKVVRHGRYVTFQLAEVAVPRDLFRKILRLIDGPRPAPLPP